MLWLMLLASFGLVDLALLAAGTFAAICGWSERRRFVHPELAGATPPLRPSNGWIWALTLVALFGFPVSAAVYYWVLDVQGAFPADADAIAIPIADDLFLAVVTAPFVTAVTWACVRWRRERLRPLAWRSDRPVLSLAVTALFTAPAVLLLVGLVQVWSDPRSQPVDHAFDPVILVGVAWCLSLRSSALRGGAERPAPP